MEHLTSHFSVSPPRLTHLLYRGPAYALVHPPGERPAPDRRRRREPAAPLGPARQSWNDGNEIRLRHRAVRCLHRAPGWRRGAIVRAPRLRGGHTPRHDVRSPAPGIHARGAEGAGRRRRPTVRLLPVGPAHGRGGVAEPHAAADGRGDRYRDEQHLPLRDVPTHPGGDPSCGKGGLMERRDFLQVTGTIAGLVIGFRIPNRRGVAPFAPNAWLRIGADDSVLVIVDRSEMGQGVTTSLPMLLAEELEADWTKIRFEFAPADKAYINQLFGIQGTGGSSSVRAAWKPLREAGAQARTMLIAAAAQTWSVEPASCRAEAGAVIHVATNRRLTYGALAQRAAALPVPPEVQLKDPKDWRLAGKPTKRLDTRFKVNGTAQFGIDVRVPGMLTAVVARSPVFGGKVSSFDATAAKAIPGVRHVVQISSGVAVVGDGYWPAKQGRDALKVSWDEGPVAQVSSASISSLFAQRATQDGAVARHDGDAVAALAGAAQRVEAVYELPFLAHATMEPMNCTAHVRAGAVDIWAPTQNQTGVQMIGGQIGGIAPEKVAVHTTYLGGGFGRRFELDFIMEALETSKAAGAPVKVIWSREDDIQHAQYRPANYHQLRAGLDAAGQPVVWTHRIVAPSIMARM